MRNKSIISIIKKHGLKKLEQYQKLKPDYKEILEKLNSDLDTDLKIEKIIDNEAQPQLSRSKVCQAPGCGKKIRYEVHLVNQKTGEQITIGKSCAKKILNLSKIHIDSINLIEDALKEKAELEKWKKDNPEIIEKLDRLSKSELPIFKPFLEEIKTSALTPEDTDYIKFTNSKSTEINGELFKKLVYMLKNDKDVKAYIKDLSTKVALNYRMSEKQIMLIEETYKKFKEEEQYCQIEVENGWDIKDYLKENGYYWNKDKRIWWKKTLISESEEIKAKLETLVGEKEIKITINNNK